jgi:hypothetical protein
MCKSISTQPPSIKCAPTLRRVQHRNLDCRPLILRAETSLFQVPVVTTQRGKVGVSKCLRFAATADTKPETYTVSVSVPNPSVAKKYEHCLLCSIPAICLRFVEFACLLCSSLAFHSVCVPFVQFACSLYRLLVFCAIWLSFVAFACSLCISLALCAFCCSLCSLLVFCAVWLSFAGTLQ